MKQFLMLFLLIFLFKTVIKSQNPATGNVWIVTVSIYHYQNKGILTDLDYAVSSAHELSALYDIRQLTYYTPVTLTDRSARRSEILKTLESTFVNNAELTSSDMILFYFSGHGEKAGGSIGICPFDYSGDVRDLITDQTIQDIMRRSRARHKVCLIESCKSAVQSQEISNPRHLEIFNQQRRNVGDGLVFITSTEADKKSWGKQDIGGYFSHFLIRGLKGEADVNNDGFVTVGELFPFVRDSVKKLSQNLQIPQINEKGYDLSMPLMVVPSNLSGKLQPPQALPSKELNLTKPEPVSQECVTKNTGDFCFENATKVKISVAIKLDITSLLAEGSMDLSPGQTQCFYNKKATNYSYICYPTGGGGEILIEKCKSKTLIIK